MTLDTQAPASSDGCDHGLALSGSHHITVIGAGIVGAMVALALLRDGHRVTLIEPGEPGGEQAASFGNGAWLSPASVVPMSTPGLWKKLPGYLSDADGPLVIRWPALPGLLPWLLRFLWAGHSVARVEATARALSALLKDAPQRHLHHAAQAGVADLVVQRGLLYLYPDRAAFQAEALSWRLRRDNGVQWAELEGPALRELLPDVDPRYGLGIRVAAGAHCLDPGAYVAALVRQAVAEGARVVRARATGFVFEGTRLAAVRTDQGEVACGRAVIAAGIASDALARQVGDRVPLASERGYHVVLANAPVRLSLPVMPSDGKMAMTPTRGGLRVAGQVELAALSAAPDWRRAELLARFARRMFPALNAGTAAGIDADAASPTSRWLGHRPSTPDSLPVIGPSAAHPDVLHAFGHGHVGLAAAPATAKLVADLLAGRSPAIDPRPYRANRF
ncbi:MAG: FAD-binding oxidoreductase [Betaproteobacteria bacterium]